jgi:hypothetical protein
MADHYVTLLSNASATGQNVQLAGGQYVWAVQGTFGGATVTLQALGPDGSTFMDVTPLTVAGSAIVRVGAGTVVRAAVSGGAPSGLYSDIRQVI